MHSDGIFCVPWCALPMDVPVSRVIAEGIGVSQSALRRMWDAGALSAEWELKKTKLVKPLTFQITLPEE